MHYNHKFALIGFVIGFLPIISGVIALTTAAWIIINKDQLSRRIDYGLFRRYEANNTVRCTDLDSFQTPQYFETIGYAILIVGLLVGVLCTAFVNKCRIHFIAPMILLMGTVIILLGSFCYIRSVMEDISSDRNTKLHVGYSLMLMIATCMSGGLLTAYFSYTAGYIHRHILGSVNIY